MATRGLSGLLDIGNSGLRAARAGMATTGRNVANASTPGYSRQIQAQSANIFGGVNLGSVSRNDDLRLLAREQDADASRARADDLHAALEPVESALTQEGHTLVDAIAALFGGFVGLTAAPTAEPVRIDAIQRASDAATAFRSAANTVAEGRRNADVEITGLADSATRIASAIAHINSTMPARDPDPAMLDERDRLSRDLSTLVGGSTQVNADGRMRFVLESGAVLVDNDRASTLRTIADPTNDGHVRLEMVSGNLTHDVSRGLTSGRIGGLLQARDVVLAGTADRIDQLAFDLTSAINQTHAAGQGLDGVSGRDLFVQPTQVRGAAAAMGLDPAVLTDHRALATGSAGGGVGNNDTALALAGLADAPRAQGGRTFTDAGIDTLASLGTEIARASSALDAAEANGDFLAGLRDARSGVSIEEEMSRLAEMQHAHAAAARFVQAVDETYADLLSHI